MKDKLYDKFELLEKRVDDLARQVAEASLPSVRFAYGVVVQNVTAGAVVNASNNQEIDIKRVNVRLYEQKNADANTWVSTTKQVAAIMGFPGDMTSGMVVHLFQVGRGDWHITAGSCDTVITPSA